MCGLGEVTMNQIRKSSYEVKSMAWSCLGSPACCVTQLLKVSSNVGALTLTIDPEMTLMVSMNSDELVSFEKFNIEGWDEDRIDISLD